MAYCCSLNRRRLQLSISSLTTVPPFSTIFAGYPMPTSMNIGDNNRVPARTCADPAPHYHLLTRAYCHPRLLLQQQSCRQQVLLRFLPLLSHPLLQHRHHLPLHRQLPRQLYPHLFYHLLNPLFRPHRRSRRSLFHLHIATLPNTMASHPPTSVDYKRSSRNACFSGSRWTVRTTKVKPHFTSLALMAPPELYAYYCSFKRQ